MTNASSPDESVSSDVAYLLEEYDEKKENVTMMNITYGERRVVREIPLDQHKTHAHPTVEIENISNEAYYTLVSSSSDRSRSSSANLEAYSRN